MIKLGMPILYEYDNLNDNLLLAKKLGLDFIELNLNFGYCRNEMENGSIDKLLKKYDLEATLHFYDEADFASYNEVVNAYKVLLKKYLLIGKNYLKKINIHINVGPIVTISGEKNYIYEKEYDSYIKRLKNNLLEIKMLCENCGIDLVLENTNTPKFIQETFKELAKSGFKFTYDIGHDNTDNYMIREIFSMLSFGEFHFHDGNTKKCHLALNDGNMDLKFFKDIAVSNQAYVLLEVKSANDLIKSVPIFKNL